MKLSVIYDSMTGNTRQAGEGIAEGMDRVPGVEARSYPISEVDEGFVSEAMGTVRFLLVNNSNFDTNAPHVSHGVHLTGWGAFSIKKASL